MEKGFYCAKRGRRRKKKNMGSIENYNYQLWYEIWKNIKENKIKSKTSKSEN